MAHGQWHLSHKNHQNKVSAAWQSTPAKPFGHALRQSHFKLVIVLLNYEKYRHTKEIATFLITIV